MEELNWQKERETIRRKALKKHKRLHNLFVEDRLSFERERKRMIEEVIYSAEDEEQTNRLWALQESLDKKLKSAGSRYNRFVLVQTLFWNHFRENWLPTIQRSNFSLNGKPCNHDKP